MLKYRQGTSIHALRTYADNTYHQYDTRDRKFLFRLPLAKTEPASMSFYFQGPYFLNEVPRDICTLKSLMLFKSKVNEYFYRNLIFLKYGMVWLNRALIDDSTVAERKPGIKKCICMLIQPAG